MDRPIIFLDIDGVVYPCINRRVILNNMQELLDEIHQKGYSHALLNSLDICASAYGFSKEAIQNIKNLIKEANAQIVISSSWKFSRDLETIKALFSLHDLDDDIQDMTSNSLGFFKEDAIEDYIETYGIKNYVVLDDIDLRNTFSNHAIVCPDVFDDECYKKALCVLYQSTQGAKVSI